MDAETISTIVGLFADLAVPAFSIAFIFAFGGKIVKSLLSMGLDGKFKI